MTAHILAFPSAAPVARALDNARQIVRDPKGLHPDAIVLEACDFLMSHGDHIDYAEAEKVQQAVMAEVWNSRRDQQEDEDGAGGLILLGFAVVGLAVYAITGWPL